MLIKTLKYVGVLVITSVTVYFEPFLQEKMNKVMTYVLDNTQGNTTTQSQPIQNKKLEM
ncbi:MAG: hypothetical protein GQ569_10255, partial [Methylococcaceae bacterium]|nr:hypothetical protein [Methylococcaceae bacterium]